MCKYGLTDDDVQLISRSVELLSTVEYAVINPLGAEESFEWRLADARSALNKLNNLPCNLTGNELTSIKACLFNHLDSLPDELLLTDEQVSLYDHILDVLEEFGVDYFDGEEIFFGEIHLSDK